MAQLDVSPHDDRTYRLVSLDNGIRALLASDANSEYGAAALSVNVGASHDPAAFPGLAHFCEHMLVRPASKWRCCQQPLTACHASWRSS